MGNLEIWYKRVNESKYHRILDFVNRSNNEPILTWTKDVSNKLQEFEIHLYNPIDEDGLGIFPKTGDSIAITDFQNNIFNNTFFGIVMSKESEPIGVTSSDSTNWIYNLKVQAPNFSTKEIILDYINSVYINDILPIIFNSTPSLGGILSNGIVILKHNYGGENFLLPPPKFQGEQFDCLVKILDGIGWTFSYYYYSELNDITGLHIIKQIDMYPKNALKSAPQDWQEGFNFNIYKNGLIDNLDYPALDDNKYIFGENKVSLSENAYSSKNSIKLKLFIKNSTGEGTKKVITSTGLTDTYNLGGAFEIKSICIKVFDENGIDVRVKTVTSSTVFTVSEMVSSTINFYQQRLIDNDLGSKMRCKIISSSIEYFSNFTINNSTQTITLETAITGLSSGDLFELVNSYDLLRENLNGYPPDVNGYIIKKLDNEQSTITFTEYDRPEAKKQIVIYYYPISQVYKTQKDSIDIENTGYRGLDETIKDSVTVEQAEEIFNEYLKLMQPLKELTLLTSHRKSILDINTNIPVVFGDINQNLIVVESSGKILSNYGFYRNKPLIVQDKIRLASYKNNIDDILLKIQNQSLAIQNMNLLNDIQEFTIDEDIFEEIGENSLNQLITPIMLDATNILVDRFTMNFISSNVTSYRVLVSSDINFIDKIAYNLGLLGDSEGLTSADISISSYSYPVYVKIQAVRGAELSSFSNIKEVETRLTQFPASITGSWGTKTLNYNYVFSPQSSGDLTNYGSSTGTAPYLDRRNSGDNYPTWVNSEGSWGLDFSSSPYSGVRIPLNNLPSSNTKSTIIVIAKLTGTSQSYVLMNISNSNIYGENASIGGTSYGISLYGRNGITGEGYSTTDFNFNSSNDMITTISADYSNNKSTIVNNENVNSVTKNGDFITQNINNADILLGTNWSNGVYGGTAQNIIIKKVAVIYDTLSDIQMIELHRLMGFTNLSPITPSTQFPASITGSWGTLTLDYGYVFNPQSSGDLNDYSGNGNVTTLERRNSGDSYATWTQDTTTGLWGIDFTNPYSALKVVDNASFELNTDYTIIALVKLNNTIDGTYRVISSKFNNNNSLSSHATYFFNQLIENHARNSISPNYGYIFDTTENISDSNITAYSTSLKCSTNDKLVIKNQTNLSLVTASGAGLVSSITSIKDIPSDMFLGGFIPYNTSTGLYDWSSTSILKGKLFGYAIIKQALTQAQIKEIHRLMGF